MTISTTIFRHLFTGNNSNPQDFTIPFPIESIDHIQAFKADGSLMVYGTDYTVSGHGLGGADSFTLRILFATTEVMSVHRRVPRLQDTIITNTSTGKLSLAIEKLTLQAQESIFETGNEYFIGTENTAAGRMRNLERPSAGTDGATISYCNEAAVENSALTRPVPPILSTDVGKVLYSNSTKTVSWEDVNSLPGSSSGKFARVDGSGDFEWRNEQSNPLPAYPGSDSWLSQSSSSMNWRSIYEMPTGYSDGQTLLSNGTSAYYSTVNDIPAGPNGTFLDIDSAIRFYLTSLEGRVSWRAYKYGTLSLDVGDSQAGWLQHNNDTEGIGMGPQGADDQYCVPDHGDAINSSATIFSALQPHLNQHKIIEVVHGINQSKEKLDAFVWFGKCDDTGGGTFENGSKVSLSCKVDDKRLIIYATRFGEWFAGSAASLTNVTIHYAVFGHHSDVTTSAGICRG